MRFWRFFLGTGIGIGLGYALVLLVLPSLRERQQPRFRTIYRAAVESEEKQTVA